MPDVPRVIWRYDGMRRLIIIAAVSALAFSAGCTKKSDEKGIKITTTIFPLYDFAREVGGDRVSVKMMLPPGAEAHTYEPTPGDIIRLNESDLFIYTGEAMEPWAEEILKSVRNERLKVVEASEGLVLIKGERHGDGGPHVDEHGDEEEHHHGEYDPHVWLDFQNDIKIVNMIAERLGEIDTANSAYYKERAAEYNKRLARLDRDYRASLGRCSLKTIIYGGHFAFGYMAERYRLGHVSPYHGFSPDAEPSPKEIAALAENVRKTGAKYVYYEELVDPRVAKAISAETGCGMLMLHGAHNLTKEELAAHRSFTDIMYDNLEKLETGLGCRK